MTDFALPGSRPRPRPQMRERFQINVNRKTISANAALPTPPSNTLLHVGGPDGGLSRICFDAFGTGNATNLTFRLARGTAEQPTAIQSADAIMILAAFGYGATGYSSGGRGQFRITAAENWTDSAQGSFASVFTVATGGSTSQIEVARFANSGCFMVGTTTNDNASAGNVGEYISSNLTAASAVSASNGSATNITSISLTAGDWDITGNVCFILSTPANVLYNVGYFNTTSATLVTAPNSGGYTAVACTFTQTFNNVNVLAVGPMRLSLSSTTTVWLQCQAGFTSGTVTAYGFIGARRVR